MGNDYQAGAQKTTASPEVGLAEKGKRRLARQKAHMPEDSLLFEKIVPALLIGMGVVTVILILFAAGVLLGFVTF